MIYIVVGVICLILAICLGVIVAFVDKPKCRITTIATTGLDDKKEVSLSDALENLEVCNRMCDVDPEYKMSPIKPGETLEPCLRGAQKILNNPEEREMMKRIYRGERKRNKN